MIREKRIFFISIFLLDFHHEQLIVERRSVEEQINLDQRRRSSSLLVLLFNKICFVERIKREKEAEKLKMITKLFFFSILVVSFFFSLKGSNKWVTTKEVDIR